MCYAFKQQIQKPRSVLSGTESHEKQRREYGIEHQKIRPCTSRHNGKVERSHRKDNEAFDASHKFDSFADFKRQLARRNRICNAFPMRPLGWDSPNKCLEKYLAQCNIGLTNLQGSLME